jgi:hypothetical protein
MLVFRVEHPETAEGPYNGPWWAGQNEMGGDHAWGPDADTHLSPHHDGMLRRSMHYGRRCACDSPAALLRWFAGFWPDLADSEYVVTIRRARRATVGQHGQVVYTHDGSTILDTLAPETFVALFTDPEES